MSSSAIAFASAAIVAIGGCVVDAQTQNPAGAGPAPAAGLIAFAQREGITHVIFGQTARSRWEVLWRGSTIERFLSTVRDAAVQVVPIEDRAS